MSNLLRSAWLRPGELRQAVREARAVYVRSVLGPLLRTTKKEARQALRALPGEAPVRCMFFEGAIALVGE
jgi:hypothetical protein